MSTVLSATTTAAAQVTATITAHYGGTFATTFGPQPTSTKAAAASIFDPSHPSPVAFDPTDPLILFIVQTFVIIAFSRLFGFFLGKIRQPKVISEVIAGIVIGPSALGRVPGFTSHIFPAPSVPYLSLVANIGLTLFLFLVGLEVDFSLFRRNARAAGTISLIGMVVPFALGAAVSVGIYHNFVDDSKVKFGTFLLFIGTANAITAFPVLARILTELDLLRDFVGVTVLTAGVGNDVVGWVLLALAIALTNASSGIIVLYVILTAIGWVLVLFFIARPLLVIACRRSGNVAEKGLGEGLVCIVLALVGTSAFITDRIGIHAIFGGFVAGLVIPHEIRHALVEKIEDLVSVLFLPLYFALSGLKTDLGLLRDGSIWGWTFCVIFVAFFSKFLSCGGVAKLNGMDWRESGAVGSLMACKGLVELIVLNIGLSAGILNPQVFAMFVTMALVTTFVTTPLALTFYPVSYRLKKRGLLTSVQSIVTPGSDLNMFRTISRYTIVLQQFDHLSALFAFTRLVKAPSQTGSLTPRDEKAIVVEPISISALRLIELTERTSALLRASESPESLLTADTLSNVFSTFTRGNGIPTSTALEIVPADSHSSIVAGYAAEKNADMIVIPWVIQKDKPEEGVASVLPNPFERMFGKTPSRDASGQASFVRRVFSEASCDVGLFLDRALDAGASQDSPVFSGRAHLFFAFQSGADDRTCLSYLVHILSRNPFLTATVVRVIAAPEPTAEDLALMDDLTTKESRATSATDTPLVFSQLTVQGGGGGTDTLYPTVNDIASETADQVALASFFEPAEPGVRSNAMQDGLSRIQYSTLSTVQPLHLAVAKARATASAQVSGVPVVVLVGRGRRGAPSHTKELSDFLRSNFEAAKESMAYSSEVRRSLGDLAVAYLVAGVGSSLLVLQSATAHSRHV